MKRCYNLVTLVLFFLLVAPVYAGIDEQTTAQRPSDVFHPSFTETDFATDSFFITQSRMPRTYMPPAALAKKPGHYTIADWHNAIDSTWGSGLPKAEKLSIFDNFWGTVDQQFACFNGIEVNWDSLGSLYRNEIVDGDPVYGVSRGRFAAIMNRLSWALKESHTFAIDQPINTYTALAPGVPLMVAGWFGADQGHFGAGLTPLPDSSLVVYKVVPDHPLGLERGDVVLGYDHVPWKQLYRELLDAELPFANGFWGSCPSSYEHSFLGAAGMNWHLFDTLDVVKYGAGDTLHLSVAPLIGQDMHLVCTEQMDIPGVPMPNTDGGQWISYGVIEGTLIGYIYSRRWSPWQVSDQFHEAVRDLVENHQTSGLIIDCRTNWGGSAILANDGMSYLFNAEELATDFAARCNQQDHLALCPVGASRSCQVAGRAAPTYDKPVAVLTGPGAISAGDMAALKFKFLSTARYFGKSTSGEFNIPMTLSSPIDWYMRCAVLNEFLVSEPGQYLTHRELEVDENVWLTKEGVAQGRDDVVEAATAWINSVQGNEPAQAFGPASINVTVTQGQIASSNLIIQNNGNWPLLFSLTPQTSNLRLASSENSNNSMILDKSGQNYAEAPSSEPPSIVGHGGFDGSGYIWMDSDQPHGPSYQWVDITGLGTRINLSDNNSIGPLDLGFDFSFYSQIFSSIYVGSNGLLTFGAGSLDATNDSIPSTRIPNNMIDPFWTNLNPQGRFVYYFRDTENQRFIVSFIEVPYYGPEGVLTFQVILNANGEIEFNYGRMGPGLTMWAPWWASQFAPPATIGIENSNGSDGLQIAYNENYMHDSLSIRIYPSWLAVTPASGHIMPGGSKVAAVSFRPGNLAIGTYTGNVYFETNDPNAPSVTIPVSMEVVSRCSYVAGDANGNNAFNGLDVTYSVNYFGGGTAPPYACECTAGDTWFVSGDVNNSCSFNGLDVTYMVNYFRGGAAPMPCVDCPPAGLTPPAPIVVPQKIRSQQQGLRNY